MSHIVQIQTEVRSEPAVQAPHANRVIVCAVAINAFLLSRS